MKKICFGFATFLLGSCLLYGSSTGVPISNVADPTSQVVVSSENTATLTPRRSDASVMRAIEPVSQVAVRENPIPPAPSLNGSTQHLAQVAYAPGPAVAWNDNGGNGNDSFVLSELDRLGAEIEKLNTRTAPPDTRRAWSAPRIGGRMFVDSVNFARQNADDDFRLQNAAGLRELRLGVQGTGYEVFDYRWEFSYNAPAGTVGITDCWIGARNIPLLGYFRVGHMRPETGQYFTMGTQNLTTMEYPTAANAFGLGRRNGVSSENLFFDDRVRLLVGVYQSDPTTSVSRRSLGDNQGQTVNVRLTTAPVFEQDGKYLFHFGGHWAHVSTHDQTASLSATPGSVGFSIPATLRSGVFANSYSNRGGLEIAMQYGRFSARSEYLVGAFSAHKDEPGRKMHGSHLEFGYFLTDGFRVYSPSSALFTGVNTNNNNFRPASHRGSNYIERLGAFQTVFQWNYLDMTDWRGENEVGGYQHDFVTGLNWFWTPQLRWSFQYIHSRQSVGAEGINRSQDIFATGLRAHF